MQNTSRIQNAKFNPHSHYYDWCCRPEQTVAAVCHWGTINIFINHEPCISDDSPRIRVPRLGCALSLFLASCW